MRRFPLRIASLVAVAVAACVASPRTASTSAAGASFWPSHPVGSVHTLMPSPTTVVYGGYDPAAAPALRVASGDEVIVGAVSTCGARLLQPGVDTGTIEPAYRAILAATRDSTLRRGPGGHILTGPIYVDGAEPGDVLEVRIESITIDLPYACNGFSPRGGFLAEDFPGESRFRVIPLDLQHMVARFSDSLGIAIQCVGVSARGHSSRMSLRAMSCSRARSAVSSAVMSTSPSPCAACPSPSSRSAPRARTGT